MRSIKFRVWEPSINKMFYQCQKLTFHGFENPQGDANLNGGDFLLSEGYRDERLKLREMGYGYLASPGQIWEQFIGLMDKNEKEIYEGDILVIQGFKETMVVKCGPWDDSVNMNHGIGFYAYGEDWGDWSLGGPQVLEVVGNIHEAKS